MKKKNEQKEQWQNRQIRQKNERKKEEEEENDRRQMATLCLLVFDEGMDRLDRTEKQSRTLLKTKPEPETVLFRVRLIGCVYSLANRIRRRSDSQFIQINRVKTDQRKRRNRKQQQQQH